MGCGDRLPVAKAPEPECGLGNGRLFDGHGLHITWAKEGHVRGRKLHAAKVRIGGGEQ